ncbi:hypothetical protein BDV29DRAFT_172236 [Aspergillus leporis]|uniref:Uncharacterized protein n=1 Tax=Aspergillus leporis TaxID=41062 RepID=A0A5N5X719_9EURO|nr:hypothetical protein BDV29DRAFT_172236 [Aspergillus leporis]
MRAYYWMQMRHQREQMVELRVDVCSIAFPGNSSGFTVLAYTKNRTTAGCITLKSRYLPPYASRTCQEKARYGQRNSPATLLLRSPRTDKCRV